MQGDINSGVGTGGIQNLPTGFFQVNGTLQLTGPVSYTHLTLPTSDLV